MRHNKDATLFMDTRKFMVLIIDVIHSLFLHYYVCRLLATPCE